jgi:acyl carrier protein/D-alanine--poly(phosphoribitol) ligase subunit 2
MNPEEMKALILDYIRKEYLDEEEMELNYDTPLISSGFVDSFSMVSLLVFLERKFIVRIPPANATAEAFDSVNKIVDLVIRYLK